MAVGSYLGTITSVVEPGQYLILQHQEQMAKVYISTPIASPSPSGLNSFEMMGCGSRGEPEIGNFQQFALR
jgi:hypothetical protein